MFSLKKIFNFNKSNLMVSISIFRQKLRLLIFKSPIEEIKSIKSYVNHIKSKLKYIPIQKASFRKQKSSKEFLKDGYATFTNQYIYHDCKSILNILKNNDITWEKGFNEKIASRYSGDPTKLLKKQLINIFNNGVDQFLKEVFNSDYKILFHVLVKSNNDDITIKPAGSMLWHSDGRNGTRINLQICYTHLSDSNGAMKCLNWKDSKKVHLYTIKEFTKWFQSKYALKKNLSKLELRNFRVQLMDQFIKDNSINYFQPNTNKSGLIYAFRNNCIHCGGFPQFGNQRIVSIMNIEPSSEITTLDQKFSKSHLKTTTNQ